MDLPTEPSDSEIIQRVKQGDDTAFRLIIERYQQSIYQLSMRMVIDAFEAEDLTQVVFLQVYKNLDKFRTSGSFKAWIFTIARNTCLNEIRRRQRKQAFSLEQLSNETENGSYQISDPKTENAKQIVLQDELVDILNKLLFEVPEKQRTALLLFQQERLTYEEISKVLGCSVGATKSLIFRAREHLKVRIKPYLSEGSWSPSLAIKNK